MVLFERSLLITSVPKNSNFAFHNKIRSSSIPIAVENEGTDFETPTKEGSHDDKFKEPISLVDIKIKPGDVKKPNVMEIVVAMKKHAVKDSASKGTNSDSFTHGTSVEEPMSAEPSRR
mmetsp:Transcript_42734/g.65631  ORF Transcript_42734/g.65631 Transcript_42734/m.65631 type:complete len:118 (+) Transcript_42734:160-513(+)